MATARGERYVEKIFSDVTVREGIFYGPTREGWSPQEQQMLSLDLYEPAKDHERHRPVVVLIHGGGYYSGDKSDLSGVAKSYARAGYVVANINYRLYPKLEDFRQPTEGEVLSDEDTERILEAFDGAVMDSRNAIAYLRSNAREFGISPERIATVGWSAGGSTSLGHVLERRFGGWLFPESTPDVDALVVAASSIGGPLVDQISSKAPPTLVVAYESDTSNSAYPPKDLCDLVSKRQGSCTLSLISGAGHDVDLEALSPVILPFLADHLAQP